MVQAGYNYASQWEVEPIPETRNSQQVKKVVTKRVSSRKKLLGKVGVGLFLYALLLVGMCIHSAVLGYQIVQLQNDIHELDKSNTHLESQIAELNSLPRVQQIAETELKMYKADSSIAVAAFTPVQANAGYTVAKQQDEEKAGPTRPLEKLAANLLQLAAAQ